MADQATLRTRLLTRMPGRTNAELDGWITEAARKHGYSIVADVPTKHEDLIVSYARYMGLEAKAEEMAEKGAVSVAGKVSINKSSTSGNFSSLIDRALREYLTDARLAGVHPVVGSGFATGGHISRPDER